MLSLDEAARRWVAEKGYDPKMGARPMARVSQEHIKRPLAEELLFGSLAERWSRCAYQSRQIGAHWCSRRRRRRSPGLRYSWQRRCRRCPYRPR